MALPTSLRDYQTATLVGAKVRGGLTTASRTASASEFTVFELIPDPNGFGISLFHLNTIQTSALFVAVVATTQIVNDLTNLPINCAFGVEPLTTVSQQGDNTVSPFNTLNSFVPLRADFEYRLPNLFIPPGKRLSVQHVTAATALLLTAGFIEHES